MRPGGIRAIRAYIPYVLMAAAALGSGGCLAVAVGGAAAGAAVGYTYFRSGVSQDFPADFATAWGATQLALGDLLMPVMEPKRDTENTGSLLSQTGTGTKVNITLETRPGKVPADGPTTEIHVRVGVVGDRALSERLLAQIQARLARGVQVVPLPVTAAAAAPTQATGLPQTAPPPLATTAEPPRWDRPAGK